MVAIIGAPQRVALETTQRKAIENEQILEISAYETNLFRQFDRDYRAVKRRCDPTPTYNCHGLTFASRRTGIFDSNTLKQILTQDGYIEVSKDDVLGGDAILYFDDSGDFEHSGIVILPPSLDNLDIPFVCSKWGKYAELLHWGNDCPYNFANVKYYRVQL